MEGRWTKARLAAGCAMAMIASSCSGGGGGGGSGGSGGGVIVVPTPTPTPTPTASPTPTGVVADVVEGTIPGLAGADFAIDYQVTNRGLYMQISRDTAEDSIVKLHGSPTASNAWSTVQPIGSAGATIFSYAPSNIYSEGDRAISFYWASLVSGVGDPKPVKWGSYTANTGGVSIRAEEPSPSPAGFGVIDTVAAGTVNGIVGPRPWIVEAVRKGSDGYRIYQDDGAYTAANSVSDRFSKAATPTLADQPTAVVSHPNDPNLYVGQGNRLFVYDADRQLRSWTLPAGPFGSVFADMIWYQNELFFSYGPKIYRLRTDNTVAEFADLPAVGNGLSGRFCVASGEVFVSNGQAISIQNRTTRSWVSRGTLTSAQTTTAQTLTAFLATGVYCSAANLNPAIYVPSADGKRIRLVSPVGP